MIMEDFRKTYIYDGPRLKSTYFKKSFWSDRFGKPLGGVLRVSLSSLVDGDTAAFLVDGLVEHVRFFNIDTPEYNRFGIQKGGKEASSYTAHILSNAKEIYLQTDPFDKLRDFSGFKRLLAWIWVDGELLNYNLVRLGYARVGPIYADGMYYTNDLYEAERLCKQEQTTSK
jgi:micrococcal nuclease